MAYGIVYTGIENENDPRWQMSLNLILKDCDNSDLAAHYIGAAMMLNQLDKDEHKYDERTKELIRKQAYSVQEAIYNKLLSDNPEYQNNPDYQKIKITVKLPEIKVELPKIPDVNEELSGVIQVELPKISDVEELPGVIQNKVKDFYKLPTSPASNLILETLEAGADIMKLPARKRGVNRNDKIEVTGSGNIRQIALENRKNSVTIELADIDKLTGNNKPAKKLFVLALIKANEQAIHKGQLTRDYVCFPLQELVDIGFYKSIRSAREGFNSGANTLTSIKIKGHIQKNNKSRSTIDALEVLFTGARIEKNQCFLRLNYAINWSFIIQYFTILPRYYFKLSNRASDLLYYIFYLARQNTRKIEERGYFTINFTAIQNRLQLPTAIGNTNPYKTIKKPIEDAIEELETEHSKLYGNTDFRLLTVCDDTAPVVDYLNNGYLQVELKGNFAEHFISISKNTEEQIEKSKKRQRRITEKAIAINTAKKLDAEEKSAGTSD